MFNALCDAMTNLSIVWAAGARRRKYADGIASHAILDILTAAEAFHYVLSFLYVEGDGQGTAGHAVGVSFEDPQSGKLMDPNYGVGTYPSRSALCSDLHELLATYCRPRGHIMKSYLLEFDNDNAFGDFQGF